MSLVLENKHSTSWDRSVAVTWPLEKLVFWVLPFLVVFLNNADFRGDTGTEFSVHWQIYLRLAICGTCGFFGALFFLPKTYRTFFGWPGMLLTFEVILYGISQSVSVQLSYTLAAWFSYASVVLMIPAAMRVLGTRDYLNSIFSALIVYLVGSWIAYLFFPSIGIFKEFTDVASYVERMGGLGHPNELGMLSAYTTLLAAGLVKRGYCRWPVGWAAMLLGMITLIACFSRTAMVCCMLGLVFVYREDVKRLGNVFTFGLSAMFGSLVVYFSLGFGWLDIFLQDLVGKITKSGSVEELSTATGRTEIWAEAIRLIGESPVLGYGYCGVRFIMDEHSYHGHNNILNGALFAGCLGGLIIALMILTIVRGTWRRPDPAVDGLAVCIVLGGMIDGLLGAATPAATAVIWISILLWRQLDMDGPSALARSQNLA